MSVQFLCLQPVDDEIVESVVRHAGRIHPSDRSGWAFQQGDALIDLISALFGVSGRDLRRSGRSGTQVGRVRQVAMYVAHVTLQLTLTEIGAIFNRDRTTVTHACHRMEDLRDDPDFDQLLDGVERMVERVLRPSTGH